MSNIIVENFEKSEMVVTWEGQLVQFYTFKDGTRRVVDKIWLLDKEDETEQ